MLSLLLAFKFKCLSSLYGLKSKPTCVLIISPKHEAFMLGTPKNKGNNKDFELLITTAPIPDLNDQLVVFGRVLKGEDVVQVWSNRTTLISIL